MGRRWGLSVVVSPEQQQDFAFSFLSILYEGAPFILLGALFSGLIDVYLPQGTMDRILPKKALPAILVAGVLGLILPVCECAVVPVIRRLVRKGLPVSCALTYMLAAPIVNPVTALSTWKAFKGPMIALGPEMSYSASVVMTASRLGLGFLVAVLVGLLVARLPLARVLKPHLLQSIRDAKDDPVASSKVVPAGDGHVGHEGCDHGAGGCCGHDHGHEHGPVRKDRDEGDGKLVAALRSAQRDFVDVGVYFTIGVMITSLYNSGSFDRKGVFEGVLNQLAMNDYGGPAALMVMAFVLSLCSTSDAFIAATLAKFSYGAKLAFLTFGPMMDVKLLFLYQTVLRRRFILLLALGLFVGIGVLSILWQNRILSLGGLP